MKELFDIPGLNIYLQIAVTVISILTHLSLSRGKIRKETAAELIAIYTIGLSGWFTIMSGLFGHIIYADQVASGIGWPLNSGFQMELGFISIGLGAVGFGGFWKRSFWLPFIIIKTVFMWGAGFTHILHAVRDGNLSPGNIGIVAYWDFIFPVLLWIIFRTVLDKKGSV